MLKQLAPKERIPPSPKSNAWSSKATDTARQAAFGPSTVAITVPPTAWPVVPPGSGTLNIIPIKEKAAPTPIIAIFSFGNSSFTFLEAWIQTGIIAPVKIAHVTGDK